MTLEKGERLRRIIEDLELSQTSFAKKIGTTANYLSGIVNGHKDLSGGILESIAMAYGEKYNMGWLITGNGEMYLTTETESSVTPAKSNARELSITERIESLERRISWLEVHAEFKATAVR